MVLFFLYCLVKGAGCEAFASQKAALLAGLGVGAAADPGIRLAIG